MADEVTISKLKFLRLTYEALSFEARAAWDLLDYEGRRSTKTIADYLAIREEAIDLSESANLAKKEYYAYKELNNG